MASDMDAAAAQELYQREQSAAAAAEVLKQRGLALLGIGKGKDIGKGKGEDKGKGASKGKGKGKGKDANVDDDSDQTGPRPETMSNDDQRVTMSLTTYVLRREPRGGRRLARVREHAGRPDPCEQSS